jgi:hypothetical protein
VDAAHETVCQCAYPVALSIEPGHVRVWLAQLSPWRL